MKDIQQEPIPNVHIYIIESVEYDEKDKRNMLFQIKRLKRDEGSKKNRRLKRRSIYKNENRFSYLTSIASVFIS